MEALQVASRITLNNILLATDFSHASKAALPYAAALADWYGAKVFVVHVVPYEPYMTVPIEGPLPIEEDVLWNRAKHEFDEFPPAGSLGGVQHEEILRRGELWAALSDVIQKQNIDLVVMGTHGRHGFKKLMLGSDAEKIYRQAACPVLTIGPHVSEPTKAGWQPKRILFATDFSEASLHALPYALSLAEENEANLTLVQMIPLVPWQYKEAIEENTRKKLEKLIPAETWCKPEFVVGFDFPPEGIVRVAKDRQADLIVMGVRKAAAAAIKAHLPWSTASEVVSVAPCPVLTVRV
jgi:nucleotide-binding universal stress UspA family protein